MAVANSDKATVMAEAFEKMHSLVTMTLAVYSTYIAMTLILTMPRMTLAYLHCETVTGSSYTSYSIPLCYLIC